MIFRIILLKIFNKERTWEILCENLGDVTLSNFNFKKYCNILGQAKQDSEKIYTDAFNVLVKYPLIGNFMAYQLVTDINYSEVVDFSETEFTIAGPGSERGIKKCLIVIGFYASFFDFK